MNTRTQHDDFLRYLGILYFGTAESPRRYVNRAYRDLSRTLHLKDASTSRESKVNECARYLVGRFVEAMDGQAVCRSDADFDAWHRATCTSLMKKFGETDMRYGHAQKWVNMTLKYLFTAHELDLYDVRELAGWYEYAHMPIDNVVLQALEDGGLPHPRPSVWSQMGEEAYFEFQKALRATYAECPMDVEFMLWRGVGRPTRRMAETG